MKVIFDTDPGVDDAMALLLLARHPAVELLGVTTAFGNADIATTTRNALFLKDRYGFDAPVARGAHKPLLGRPGPPPDFVHGKNGLGEIDIPAEIRSTVDARPAHRLIIDLVRQHPNEITIIAVGRMTNLALAAAEAPDIVPLVKRLVVMGGAFGYNGHYGNVTPVGEANVCGDPHAADEVFNLGWPMTIVGLDVTSETVMDEAYLAGLPGDDGAFVRAISQFYKQGSDRFPVHDSSAVAFALHPEFYGTRRGVVRVVPNGIAAGQTIIGLEGAFAAAGPWAEGRMQSVAVSVNAPAVLAFYRATLERRTP